MFSSLTIRYRLSRSASPSTFKDWSIKSSLELSDFFNSNDLIGHFGLDDINISLRYDREINFEPFDYI
jgi:hypothetical protein